ncbi:MFS transporter [Herbiconiux moechotypicola]|uniref:MFS transporter n=1 Tax=Herbiconiux moechotypicola TaxID=637393 RepID=A0ABN3DFY1_9MICO|nr:MFS transporter [Herbiconiux moechotypicola]MCS5729311.1 MFS transporter [Herbiconiux moechotypicola]
MVSAQARSQGSRWVIAGIVFASVVVASAAGAGTPLLALYQRDWGFPLWELTLAFSVYAGSLLLTLLVAGSLSDHVGRRPVLIGALALMIVSGTLFLIDDSVGWVVLARAIQGVATGAATSTFTATIIELSSERHRGVMTVVTSAAPVGGLALGALLTGVVSDAVHDPTRLVFGVLIVSFVVGMIAVFAAEETSARTPGAARSLRPRLVVPPALTKTFVAVAPLVAAGWMFSGLFLGLAPTFDRTVFELSGGALNGVMVALQPAAAALIGLVFARVAAPRAAAVGAVLMLAGASLAVAGLLSVQLPLVAAGAVVGGAGQGAGFGSSLRILGERADNADRGGLFSAVYLVAYAGYGVPVLIAGGLSGALGLAPVVTVYGAVVAALAAWALVAILRTLGSDIRRSTASTTVRGGHS